MTPIKNEQLGPVSPGLKTGISTDIALTNGVYSINVHTRNDTFNEWLTLGPGQDMLITDHAGKVIYRRPKAR